MRSAAEALVALRGGASFIDVKEPASGALGRASRAVHIDVLDALASARSRGESARQRVTATAALGELDTCECPSASRPVRGYALFKLGLSRCALSDRWTRRLDAWRERLRAANADIAAVAYADHRDAQAPDPREVLRYAIDRRLRFLLVDTWGKEKGSLTDFVSLCDLRNLLDEAHAHGLSVALAGSLRLEDVPDMLRLGADVIAVRGAACKDGKREEGLDADRVAELARLLAGGAR